jgi:hypothetical protein
MHLTLSELDAGLKKRNGTLYDDKARDKVNQTIELLFKEIIESQISASG